MTLMMIVLVVLVVLMILAGSNSSSSNGNSIRMSSISLKKLVSSLVVSSSMLSLPVFPSYASSSSSSSSIASTELPIPTPLLSSPILTPTDQDNQLIQVAFRDYNLKRFDDSEIEFTNGIERWRELNRPRDEIVSLLKARGNVRLDSKNFKDALIDCNSALALMTDCEKDDGTGRYPEYVDTFVQRGLVYEGLGQWDNALNDYDKAIKLWGGGRGDNVNPYVLVFRGNVLGRLNRWNEAAVDFSAASTLFLTLKDIPRYSDSRANEALALFQIGEEENSVKAMNDVIRKNPGYTDMHVALAAVSWDSGNYIKALSEWRFACNDISSGCEAYKDVDWLIRIRRWPPSLVQKLQKFQTRELPTSLTDKSQERLAPQQKY